MVALVIVREHLFFRISRRFTGETPVSPGGLTVKTRVYGWAEGKIFTGSHRFSCGNVGVPDFCFPKNTQKKTNPLIGEGFNKFNDFQPTLAVGLTEALQRLPLQGAHAWPSPWKLGNHGTETTIIW